MSLGEAAAEKQEVISTKFTTTMGNCATHEASQEVWVSTMQLLLQSQISCA